MDNLLNIANVVPEMGNGGKKIKEELIREAAKVVPGNAIVDIAPFLGSTTVFLSYGLFKSENLESTIYSVDLWDINLNEKYQKWLDCKKLDITDLRQEYNKNIKPFTDEGIRIKPIKSDIRNYNYSGELIQIIVDDSGVDKGMTDHVLKSMSPYFIPGKTIIFFMDYYFFQNYHDFESRLYQHDLMEVNKKVFKFIEHPKNSCTAIYQYLGGEINFIESDKYYYNWEGVR